MTQMEIAHYAGQGLAIFFMIAIVITGLSIAFEFLSGIVLIVVGVFLMPFRFIKGIIKFFIYLFTRGRRKKLQYADQQVEPVQQVVVDLGDSIGVITKILKTHIKKRGE